MSSVDRARLARLVTVLLLGAALTAGVLVWARQVPPVAVAEAQVVLIAPRLTQDNALAVGVGQRIAVASVVERAYAGGPADAHVVGNTLTLADQGLREGTSVRVHNAGSQWADDFNRPMLDIQVVDSSSQAARRQVVATVTEVRRTLVRLQRDAGVRPEDRVRMRLAPAPVVVRETGGDPRRATAGAVLLGLLLTTAGATRLARRRRPAGAEVVDHP